MSQDKQADGPDAEDFLQDCGEYQKLLPQLNAQSFRIEQSQKRLEQITSNTDDKLQMKLASARTEIQVLEKNMNMLKSRGRSIALKHLSQKISDLLQVETRLNLSCFKQVYRAFSVLYLGATEPALAEQQEIDLMLKNLWSHFKVLLEESESCAVDLDLENQTVGLFRQRKFHPLEKMALTRFHQLLLQLRIKARQKWVSQSFQQTGAESALETEATLFTVKTSEVALSPPDFGSEDIEKQLHLIQRQLFQIQSQLRNPLLRPRQREQTLLQRDQLKAKQDLVYSQLRQLFVWQSLENIQDFARRFAALHSQLSQAQNVNQVFSISERGDYTQKMLNQELYQLYLDCRQTAPENTGLKSLAFIQNQQDKVQRLGADNYAKIFGGFCRRDAELLDKIKQQTELFTAGESSGLAGLIPPIHGVLEQLNEFQQAI